MISGERLFAVMYVINGLLALASLIAIEMFLRRLQANEPNVHRDLGEPLVFTNNTGINTIRGVWFLLSRKYRMLADKRSRRLGNIAFAMLVLTLAMGGITSLYFARFAGAPSI